MSKAADEIKSALRRYVEHMRDTLGREPGCLYVSKRQWDILRAEEGGDPEKFKPRFMGIEVKKDETR